MNGNQLEGWYGNVLYLATFNGWCLANDAFNEYLIVNGEGLNESAISGKKRVERASIKVNWIKFEQTASFPKLRFKYQPGGPQCTVVLCGFLPETAQPVIVNGSTSHFLRKKCLVIVTDFVFDAWNLWEFLKTIFKNDSFMNSSSIQYSSVMNESRKRKGPNGNVEQRKKHSGGIFTVEENEQYYWMFSSWTSRHSPRHLS